MIKTKLGLILGQINTIQGIATDKMNSQGAYRLHKLFKTLSNEQKELEELRMKLINEYATKDKELQLLVKDNQYQFSEENLKAYTEKYEELLNTDTEIDVNPLPFSYMEGARLSVQDIEVLEKFLEFEKVAK